MAGHIYFDLLGKKGVIKELKLLVIYFHISFHLKFE